MTTITRLAVAHAKEINRRLDAKGTVILAFREDGTFEIAEYGKTKQDCSHLKEWIEDITERLSSGRLRSPW